MASGMFSETGSRFGQVDRRLKRSPNRLGRVSYRSCIELEPERQHSQDRARVFLPLRAKNHFSDRPFDEPTFLPNAAGYPGAL